MDLVNVWETKPIFNAEGSPVALAESYVLDIFAQTALASKKKFYRLSREIYLPPKQNFEEFVRAVESTFCVTLLYKSMLGTSTRRLQFSSPHTFVEADCCRNNTYEFTVISFLNYENALTEFSKNYKRKPRKTIRILVDDGGAYLKDVDFEGKPLERSNYTDAVLESVDHVVADLNAPDPCGRVILFDGPPGTGKTRAIMSLPGLVPKGLFVMIPSGMIGQMSSPGFLNLLLSEKPEDGPLVLIVEDADEAITERKSGSPDALSSILNMSDGIYGQILDIRILASTNAPISSLDNAVTRPGRLCRRIEIGALPASQANAIYQRITGNPGPFAEGHFITLAEVYLEASGKKATSTERFRKPPKSLGFSKSEKP